MSETGGGVDAGHMLTFVLVYGCVVNSPYGPFAMDPASAVLHYALEVGSIDCCDRESFVLTVDMARIVQCFEGLKAYVDADGKVRLFRPDMNMKRLNRSMKRLMLPVRSKVDY